jgi:predicted MPP superfamily phosphohydrolase
MDTRTCHLSARKFRQSGLVDEAKHLPDSADRAPLLDRMPDLVVAYAGYDLQLSGHTHGGQFWPWNRHRELGLMCESSRMKASACGHSP